MKTTQVTLSLESKPGVLAKVARVLADAGVNITGLYAAETMGRGKLRLLVSDVPKAKEALTAAQYRLGQETILTLTLQDHPGTLAGIAEKLAQAKINIKFAYGTTAGEGQSTVVLGVSNADKAQQVLGG